MRKIVGFALLGLVWLSGPASAQKVMNYAAQGTNPDGSRYNGIVQVQETDSAYVRVRWMIGNASVEGIGLRSGNIYSAAYSVGPKTTLVLYTMNSDGSLHGTWAVQGSKGTGTETLTPR